MPKRQESRAAADQCVIPNCSRSRYSRGLCKPCYQSTAARVQRGDVSWKQLIESGLAFPEYDPRTTGGVATRAMYDAGLLPGGPAAPAS